MPEINFLKGQKKKARKKSKKGTPKIKWSDPKADKRGPNREKAVRNFFGFFSVAKSSKKAKVDNVDIKAARKEILKTIKEAEEAESAEHKDRKVKKTAPRSRFIFSWLRRNKAGEDSQGKKITSRVGQIKEGHRQGGASPSKAEVDKSIVGEPSPHFSSQNGASKKRKDKKAKEETKMPSWWKSFFNRSTNLGVEIDYKKAYKEDSGKIRKKEIKKEKEKKRVIHKDRQTHKQPAEKKKLEKKAKIYFWQKSFFRRRKGAGDEINYNKIPKEKNVLTKPPQVDSTKHSQVEFKKRTTQHKKEERKREKRDSIYFIIHKYIHPPRALISESSAQIKSGKKETDKKGESLSWWKNLFGRKKNDKSKVEHRKIHNEVPKPSNIAGIGISTLQSEHRDVGEIKKEEKNVHKVVPVPEPPVRIKPEKKKVKKQKAEKKIKYKIWENLDVLKTNLIKDEFVLLFGWQKKAMLLSLVISVSFLIIVAAYGGLVLWERRIGVADKGQMDRIEELSMKIEKVEAEVDNIIAFQKKLKLATQFLDSHIYWTNFFKFLEDRTLTNIYYAGGFSGNTSGSYTFPAIAEDFKTVAQQIQVMEADDYVEEARTTGGAVSPGGGVSFNLGLFLNPDIFYKPF